MRKLLQRLLTKPLMWISNRLAASPRKELVFKSLTQLHKTGQKKKSTRLKVIPIDFSTAKFIIFSDQHKGNTSWADDFNACETNYVAALEYYNSQQYHFINLGDSEELWKFTATDILTKHQASFKAEAAFQPRRYFKTFGNHDIIWKNKLDVIMHLKKIFSMPLPVYEGIILRSREIDIFLTHGHQGDLMSDNNAFSTWIVAHIWMPLQRYLRINPNSASNDYSLRNLHNKFMYEWSSRQKNLVLVTGHTHQPVFASGRYHEHPSNNIPTGKPRDAARPSYFNTGCCCFNDGDITGIELSGGFIRLIKWDEEETGSKRKVLEEVKISQLISDLME